MLHYATYQKKITGIAALFPPGRGTGNKKAPPINQGSFEYIET